MLWCLGMYASGSTWAFNAAMKVAAVVVPRTPAVGRFVTRHDELDFLDDPMRLPIVKSHDTDAAAAAALASRADTLLASIRDPRDCITSLMLYQHYGFDLALATIERTARFCARFVSHPNAVLLRYEAGFIDDPATLDRIATSLGGSLTAVDRDRIFMATRRPAIEAHTHGLTHCHPRYVTKSPVTWSTWRRYGTVTTRIAPARSAAGATC